MLPFEKILFPFDYSAAGEAILPYVREMTKRFQAKLIVLHVLPLYADPGAIGDFMGAVPLAPLEPKHRKPEEEQLQSFCMKRFGDGNVEALLEDGDVAMAIERVANKHAVDLIMMPTSGVGPIRRLLLGSVTSKVLHDLDCAVWTGVHEHLPEAALQTPYQKIVCGLGEDAISNARLALAAAKLSKIYGAKLTLIHGVETPSLAWDADMTPYRDQLMAEAQASLGNLVTELGIEASVRVFADATADGIRRAAVQESADLLVMGRGHAQEGMSSMWSHLYSTIRVAPCPVLSMP